MTKDPITILNFDPVQLARARASDHLRQILLPEEAIFPLRRPVLVRILIVIDGSGGFDDRDFGLHELISVLAVSPGPWVRFAITTAHRANDSSAMLKNFRFDAQDLAYDQIWLFGVDRAPNAMTGRELRALATFMDKGGGVFATGDHENLGETLCSHVPRVRNMRAWYWPGGGPNGEPVAPRVDGADRHDTLVRRGAEDIVFDHQSDDVPQEIFPVMRSVRTGIVRTVSFPHEVLCGPAGIIRHMPDHPHEGECYAPTDLNRSFTFDGQSFVEYPVAASGTKPAPQIIARSHHASRGPGDVKGNLDAADFGSISAYDGHVADIGRVLVDSTWHHFFNINLKGNPFSSDPRSRTGFYGSASGLAVYEEIKAYFRNIAVYLSRPAQLKQMRNNGLWWVRFDHRLAMDLRLELIDRLKGDDRLIEYVRIGTLAKDALGQLASRCQIVRWVFDLPKVPKLIRRFVPPGEPVERDGVDVSAPAEVLDLMEPALLGAAVYGLAREGGAVQDRTAAAKLSDERIEAILERSANDAVELGLAHLEAASRSHLRFYAALSEGGAQAN